MAYPAYNFQPDAGVPVAYSAASPYTGGYTMPSMPAMPAASMPATYTPAAMPAASMMPAGSNLDHGQGKWFAPGEALPPGFVITSHPEGHTAPQGHHSMTDKARESFVVTGSSAMSALPAKASASAPEKKTKKGKKKSKSSACC